MNASGFSRQAAHSTKSSLLHSATRMRNSQPENEVETIELSFSCNWAQFTRLFRCQQTEIKKTNSAVAKDKVFRPNRLLLLPIRLQNFLIYIETSNSLSKCLDKDAVLLGIKAKSQGHSHNMWRCFESIRKYPAGFRWKRICSVYTGVRRNRSAFRFDVWLVSHVFAVKKLCSLLADFKMNERKCFESWKSIHRRGLSFTLEVRFKLYNAHNLNIAWLSFMYIQLI